MNEQPYNANDIFTMQMINYTIQVKNIQYKWTITQCKGHFTMQMKNYAIQMKTYTIQMKNTQYKLYILHHIFDVILVQYKWEKIKYYNV